MVNPEDIRKLARLAAVLVLIAKTCIEDRDPPNETTQKSTRDTCNRDVLVAHYQRAKKFKTSDSEDEFTFGEVKVNFPEMLACRNGESVGLTNIEFKTLKYFIQNAKRVISRNELLNEVWGYENYPCTRTVDNHILRLRQKLERDPSRPIHFSNGSWLRLQVPAIELSGRSALNSARIGGKENMLSTNCNLSDSQVIRLAQDGDAAAFEYLYKAHSKHVYSVCLRMLKNATDAEDLTQQVFLRLFNRSKSARPECSGSSGTSAIGSNHPTLNPAKHKHSDFRAWNG
jgi:hypothetical protein